MIHLLSYIIDTIEKLKLKHEVHRFSSGAIMIDIWITDKFIVVQIDKESIGLSLITAGAASFDTIPDLSFSKEILFKKEFEKILLQNQ